MKNNKKFNRTFQLSLVATALSLANLGWATDLTCNTTTGCKYIQGPGNTWYINDTATQLADAVNVTVEAGNYQNKAKTETGASTSLGRPSQSSDALFHIFDLTKQDNVITLKSGVKATLKEDYTSSQLVHVNGATANLEQGVKLIVDKNYSQIHNIPDANGNFDGNAAIESRNSTINTQADIELNNDGSNAIESQETSIINSSNHKITMNGENNGAYTLFGKDIVNIENVTITGNKDLQSVFDIGNDRTEEQIVNAKKLNATLNDKSIFMNLHDSGTQTVTLRDSKIKAGYGLHAVPLGDEHTVTLNLHNSELNTTRALVSINDPNFPVDEEDEEEIDANAASTFHLHLIADNNSKLSGAIIENPQRPAKTEVNVTLANSQWNFNQSSILHHLNTQNSTVKFEPTSEYKTLTIKGDLTGSTTFDLNTNIAENKTDKIVVKGKAEGDHHLNVTDHGTHVANGKVTLVETNTGNAKFHLANANGYVALGAYKYFLTPEGKNWVLAHSQSAGTPQPQPQPQPQPSITPSLPATAQLLESANAQVSLRQAELLMVENELNGIHQRLGEIRTGEKGNIWVKNVNSHQKLTALSTGESQTSGFKQNVHSLQIGADAAATDKVRLGGFVGHSQANIDFNNHYGNGKVKGQTLGLYGTYLADNGVYLDNIAQYSRLTADSNHTEKHRYNAYTLSSEIGKQFQLAGAWTVTPQAQLAWTHINGKEKEDSLSAISSRIGLRLAKTFELSQGWKLQPYAEANAITTRLRHSDINYNGSQLNVESYRGRFTSAVGFNAGFGNHRMGVEVNRADGKHIKQPFGVQAVYRFQW